MASTSTPSRVMLVVSGTSEPPNKSRRRGGGGGGLSRRVSGWLSWPGIWSVQKSLFMNGPTHAVGQQTPAVPAQRLPVSPER